MLKLCFRVSLNVFPVRLANFQKKEEIKKKKLANFQRKQKKEEKEIGKFSGIEIDIFFFSVFERTKFEHFSNAANEIVVE